MNLELKTKLVDFDVKTTELWESMDEIEFTNPELLDDIGYKEDLIKAFNRIKNAIFLCTPREVYGISNRENIEEPISVGKETTSNFDNCPLGTHLYVNGKWIMT